MKEILNKLDELIRDMDVHEWDEDSEVYAGITYGEVIKIARVVKEYSNDTEERYFEYP